MKQFEGSGVCGTWDINYGPHFLPDLQIAPKSPDKYDDVTDEIFFYPNISEKVEVNGACRTWDTKSGLHFVSGL